MIQRVEIEQKRASKIGFDTHVRITDISHGIIGKTNLEEYIILNVHIQGKERGTGCFCDDRSIILMLEFVIILQILTFEYPDE